MKILLISTVINNSLRRAIEDSKYFCTVNLIYSNNLKNIEREELQSLVDNSDIILIDVRGDPGILKDIDFGDKDVIVLVGGSSIMARGKLGRFKMPAKVISEISNPDTIKRRIDRIQKIIETLGKILPVGTMKDARDYVRIMRYWANAGYENYKNMFLYIYKIKGAQIKVEDPIEFPEYGFYHPNTGFGYFPTIDPDKPTIGIIFYGGMHFESCLGTLELLLKKFKDFNVIPVFSEGILNLKALEMLFSLGNIDAVVSLLWFRLDGGPLGGSSTRTIDKLKIEKSKLFTPAMMFTQKIDSWKESPRGLDPITSLASVVLPETDGAVDPIPICGVVDDEVMPIEDRIERFSERIKNWIKLRKKDNAEKKIAIIIYNYPPGKENLGRAAYLDTFRSLDIILNELRKRGYYVENTNNIETSILNRNLFNTQHPDYVQSPRMSLEEYIRFFNELPDDLKREIIERYGSPPGQIMVDNNSIVIPALVLGNVSIIVQPSRQKITTIEDMVSNIHDSTSPPHHQYLATYFWIQKIFNADAVIHLGTHGTAEFTKGKEIGLSSKCYPDILIGNLPNIYLYHVVNTSEAAIAKRRLYSTLISYNSPPYSFSGLYDDYLKLEDLIDEYRETSGKDPIKSEIAKKKAIELAKKLNMVEDLDSIELKLYEFKRSLIPKGLHIIGERYTEKDFRDFLLASTLISIGKKIAEKNGLDFDKLDITNRKKIENEAECIISRFLAGNYIEKEYREILEEKFEAAKKFIDNSLEIENLLEALEGKYIEPSPGGDVIRNLDALPTGRNIYPFDPTKIPTESASERGKIVAKEILKRYKENTGKYPETVAVILWGFETANTYGETVSQIFEYLGVEIVHKTPWEKEIRIRNLEELGRPRIDVVVTICGLFRDMFPNLIELIDTAFKKVSELDEPEDLNYVKKHKNAKFRIFGPQTSEYGTRMLPLMEDSAWNTENDLVEAYLNSMCYAYGKESYGLKAREDFETLLKTVDLTSQVRSNTDYEITDLDHYYEFFGGLAKSVEIIKGKKPTMLFVDSTKHIPKVEDIRESIERGTITRTLNPLWIEENLKHGFLGVQKISERIENLLGLAVTTNAVHNTLWEKIFERYILDEKIFHRMKDTNLHATKKIIEKLMEAERRGYWTLSKDVKNKLEEKFVEIDGILEEVIR